MTTTIRGGNCQPDPFDIEPGEEYNYQNQNHNKASGKVYADKELAEARKAELAAKTAFRAPQNQKQEEKMDAIIYRAREGRTVKRTASSEIPESVKGTEQDRRKNKNFRALCELEKYENIVSRLDDNIRKLVNEQ